MTLKSKYTFENTEGAIKKGQSTETGNIEVIRISKQKHNTICLGQHYAQTNTNNGYKTCSVLQTTGGTDEPNIVLFGNRNGHHNTARGT